MVSCKYFVPISIVVIIILDILLLPFMVVIVDDDDYVKYSSASGDERESYSYSDLFSTGEDGMDMKDVVKCYSSGFLTGTEASSIFKDAEFYEESIGKYALVMLLYKAKDQQGDVSLNMTLRELFEKDDKEFKSAVSNAATKNGYITEGKLVSFSDELYMVASIKGEYIPEKDEFYEFLDETDKFVAPFSDDNSDICMFRIKGYDSDLLESLNEGAVTYPKDYPDFFFKLKYNRGFKAVLIALFITQFAIPVIIRAYKGIL